MESHAPAPLKFLHNPDLGILLVRVALGVAGIFHGSQKLFGAWGGPGMKNFAGFLTSLKVPMPEVSAWMAALAEFGGGILILAGLLTRLVSVPYAFTMFVAFATAHQFSFVKNETTNGSDFPFLLGVFALALVFTGPGKYSVQALMSRPKTA